MVIDEDGDQRIPRYLAYDIILFEGQPVGQAKFSLRLLCIDKEIIQARAKYMHEVRLSNNVVYVIQKPYNL